MAYVAANFVLLNSVNGFGEYRYDTTDELTTVEAANYFNNRTNSLNLAKGDTIQVVVWATAVRTGTISKVSDFIVTNVIANDAAAAAGNVNIAEYGVSSAGAISSLA